MTNAIAVSAIMQNHDPQKCWEYDGRIPALQQMLLDRRIPFPPWKANADERAYFRFACLRILAEEESVFQIPRDELPQVAERLAANLSGLGVLEPYLASEGIEEIIVRNGLVQVERAGQVENVGYLASDDYFRRLAERVAEMGNKPLRAANPFVLVDLPDGSRFTAMIPPLSHHGTAINIRVFARQALSLESLVDRGALTAAQAGFLATAFGAERASLVISGKPGAGKTTLANALLARLPETTQICIAETFEEMRVPQKNVARAVVREDVEAGRVTMRDVVNVLYTRMRPDVLVVGEVVADEAREFLQAINLGVTALTTIHGNSALDALYRLETLALSEGLPLAAVRERVARGIRLVAHVDKDAHGRRCVAEIVRVESLQRGQFVLRPALPAPEGPKPPVGDSGAKCPSREIAGVGGFAREAGDPTGLAGEVD